MERKEGEKGAEDLPEGGTSGGIIREEWREKKRGKGGERDTEDSAGRENKRRENE